MFAVNIAIHQFCLQLTTISIGFAVNSSYRDVIDYQDNLQRISQNIAIMYFWLSHRPNSICKIMIGQPYVCGLQKLLYKWWLELAIYHIIEADFSVGRTYDMPSLGLLYCCIHLEISKLTR